jgi:putative transposase
VREGGRVQRKALVLAYGVHEQGIREVIAIGVGPAETEAFWREFLRSLVNRGLAGVQLVVSDAHTGLKAAIGQVLGCPWQRCTVHFLREALGHCPKDAQGMVAAAIRPIFNADSGQEARRLLGETLTRLERPLPKIAAMLVDAEDDGSPATPSRAATTRSSRARTRSSGSTARSAGAPTSSGSSRTTARCSGSPAPY